MRAFEDFESGRMVYEDDLRREFEQLREIDPETYDYSFERYVENCTSKNGTLKRVNIGEFIYETIWNTAPAKEWLHNRGIRYESIPYFSIMRIKMWCSVDRYNEFVAYMNSL